MLIDSVITSKEDPTKLFDLLEELAVGSYGHVYKVRQHRAPPWGLNEGLLITMEAIIGRLQTHK